MCKTKALSCLVFIYLYNKERPYTYYVWVSTIQKHGPKTEDENHVTNNSKQRQGNKKRPEREMSFFLLVSLLPVILTCYYKSSTRQLKTQIRKEISHLYHKESCMLLKPKGLSWKLLSKPNGIHQTLSHRRDSQLNKQRNTSTSIAQKCEHGQNPI